MIKGSKCFVYEISTHKGNKYEGVIACEPQLHQESMDFWVLVMIDGKLNRVDTDYIEILGITPEQP